jgi:FkbM family methyltransferase
MTVEYAAAHLAAFHPGRSFTVLQVGAYDGVALDPLAGALNAFGWRAVLVEPQPGPFEALRDHHAGNPEVQVFNVAIADRDGYRQLFTVEPADDLPDWAPQMASFNRHHIIKNAEKYLPGIAIAERIKVIEVPTWTFDTLLARSHTSRVDILQIDTEGYDLEVLRLFDVPRRMPVIVNYEHRHLSRSDRAAAAELLVGCGYRLAMFYEGGDTVAVTEPRG